MNNNRQKHPILFKISFALQFVFWKIVVFVGYLFQLKMSARFLNNSITREKNYIPNDITIKSQKDIQKITNDSNFKEKINYLLNKYAINSSEFIVNANTVKEKEHHDIILNFENHDLFLSLHGTIISVNGIKNENGLYDLTVTIDDTYDFTKIKQSNENGNDFVHLIGNTLNNIAVVSSEYGVLKTFKIDTTIYLKDLSVNN